MSVNNLIKNVNKNVTIHLEIINVVAIVVNWIAMAKQHVSNSCYELKHTDYV